MRATDRTIDDLLDGIASERVGPAGGTAAAFVGATGAACCEMVCIHSLDAATDRNPLTTDSVGSTGEASSAGEDGSTSAAADLVDAREELRSCRGGLLELGTADERLVDALFGGSAAGIDDADLKRATGVPLSIAEHCLVVLDVATAVVAHGTPRVVPDAITGTKLTNGALSAALFTVRCNLGRIEDPSFRTEVTTRIEGIEASAADATATVGDRAATFTDGTG